jgi:hypothetical protein
MFAGWTITLTCCCRRVALYRRYLGEGVSAELAIVYLREIAEVEAELAGMGG